MAMVGEIVVDASAALAFLRNEPGGERVPSFLARGTMSVVNYAEVAQRFWRDDLDPTQRLADLTDLGLQVVRLESDVALLAAELIRKTKPFGCSLADRICLAEGLVRNLPVLTADRPWDQIGLTVRIERLR
jgi:ribonuclease VapC